LARRPGKATSSGDKVKAKTEYPTPLQERLDLGNSLLKFGSFFRGRKSSILDYRFCKELNNQEFPPKKRPETMLWTSVNQTLPLLRSQNITAQQKCIHARKIEPVCSMAMALTYCGVARRIALSYDNKKL